MPNIEESLNAVIERNKRVEAEKAWEVSITRRLFVAGLTYITALVTFWFLDQPQFALIALVPALAYVVSTLSLPWMKRRWMKKRQNGL
ncbi:MAG: hypothetical protein HOO67_01385 [Candidatus Peribacteraceae bacterium]|nr:hypothetical protein [Candidatus Peribacteraceae bacterium]